jgi:hypothetical protein
VAADPHVVSALQDKAHDLRSAITTYEELLERSRHELAVVTATLSLFQRGDDRIYDHRPAHARNLFKRGEPLMICKTALAAKPAGMTTRELAVACLAAREFDYEDPVLVRAMTGLLSNTLKKAVRRSEVARIGANEDRKALWSLRISQKLLLK